MGADLFALLPELVLAVLAMAVLLGGLARGRHRHAVLGAAALASLALTAVALAWVAGQVDPGSRFFFGMFALDRFAASRTVPARQRLSVILSLAYLSAGRSARASTTPSCCLPPSACW
jgi:NADH:ubiquinone oxidoreductase subunit 2 (subunit N)